ncbi:hypothetical protein [Streptomyces sp. NPDC049879]|uniref:hypothetical protein n=1 Tax=Streptomyces sp. NPDC049879 TaxID=3365598 RepID=UPI0037AB5DDC
MTDNAFPPSLLAAQRTLVEGVRRLAAIPLRPYEDGAGVLHRTGNGWRADHDQVEADLRRQLLDATLVLQTDPYWQTVADPVAARQALKVRVRELADAETSGGGPELAA